MPWAGMGCPFRAHGATVAKVCRMSPPAFIVRCLANALTCPCTSGPAYLPAKTPSASLPLSLGGSPRGRTHPGARPVLRLPIPGPPAKRPRPENSWHRGVNPYCPYIRKPDRLACLSPLQSPENSQNLLPRPHLPRFSPLPPPRPLPTPPPHDPRPLLYPRSPKANSFQQPLRPDHAGRRYGQCARGVQV